MESLQRRLFMEYKLFSYWNFTKKYAAISKNYSTNYLSSNYGYQFKYTHAQRFQTLQCSKSNNLSRRFHIGRELYFFKAETGIISKIRPNTTIANFQRTFSSSVDNKYNSNQDPEKNLSLVQKFKLMYKQYWYVLIPVHVFTSAIWYGSFFIMAKSGVDIVPTLEWLGVSESVLTHLRDSNAGYYAIAYAMYKIATPARYTVTLGGTTISINYLKEWGYIKPVPTKEQIKEMYTDKKEELIERKEEVIEKYHERRDDIKEKYQEKKGEMIERYQEKRGQIFDKYQERKENIKDKLDGFKKEKESNEKKR